MSNNEFRFRLLRADEIDVRVGNALGSAGYSLLLYKDARADMNVLDEALGIENWTREHTVVKDVLYCTVRARIPLLEKDPKTGEVVFKGYSDWVSKQDCGTESKTEGEKGESSDSFKRACVNLGIGRELYTSPNMAVFEPMDAAKKRRFYVSGIKYRDDRTIEAVQICDARHETFKKVYRN